MIGNDDWVRITEFPSHEEASSAGASLLESGVVATLDDEAGYVVLSVLPDDVSRACELLGVAEPAADVLPLDQPLPAERIKWRFPRERLGLFIVGYLVVLVALCVVIFFVVVWLLGGYESTEMPSVRQPP